MKMKSALRLEWISLVYLALFVFAVLSPSLISKDYLGLEERHVEEFLIFLFGITGMVTFSVYERIMEHKEKEHQEAKSEYERARRELIESYRYIGSINRQIEVLKRITNRTSIQVGESQRMTRDLLSTLLANAAQCVGARHAILRYVVLDSARTEHEMVHGGDAGDLFRVSNKQLVRLHHDGISHDIIHSDDGKQILAIPSDHAGKPVKAFLLLAADPKVVADADTSLLKVFANQAGLLYYTQAETAKRDRGVLDLIEEAEKGVIGEVK